MILNSVLLGACALPLVWGITPKQMLAAPRRSDPKPNPSGEWAVFTETTFDWDTEKSSTKWKLMNVATGNITDLRLSSSGASEIVWIGPTQTSVLYLNSSNDAVAGGVTLWSTDLAATGAAATNNLVASLPAAFSGLKAVKTKEGGINFLVNALANRNGTVYNSQLVKKPTNTGRLYKNTYPRHWDTYLTKERYAVFAGNLVLKDSKLGLSGQLRNLLKDVPYSVTQPESPVQPFGDLGDYDLSSDGKRAVFLAKAPELPKANHTASYIYLVPHDGSSVATAINGPKGRQPKNVKGASASPRFSPDGRYVAYLQMDDISYESGRNKIYIADLDGRQTKIDSIAENWDRSPASLTWEPRGKTIYATTPDTGVVRLFPIPIDARANYQPKNITDATSSVSSFGFLSNDQLLVSSSSQYSSKHITIVSKEGRKKSLFTAHTIDAELKGFGPSDVESIWYQGVLGVKQEAIVVKPTGFQPNKKYPWVMVVHGGPQGYTGNSWSTRWNLKVWADQGYVVVAPNPTGSTSYGQELTDVIQNNWGSYPYEDLVNAWKYVRDNISYIDIERGVEAGASFGGYMTNWIQGHDLGRKFKALVSHDGTTTVAGKYVTDELFFIQHEFNGTSWEQPENYKRWDPINHVANWSTPHFIIHSDLDYRLPVAEGIMLFNILQTKGVPSRFLNFADENHWVSKRQNSLVWHTEIFNWINYYSGISDTLDDNAIGW